EPGAPQGVAVGGVAHEDQVCQAGRAPGPPRLPLDPVRGQQLGASAGRPRTTTSQARCCCTSGVACGPMVCGCARLPEGLAERSSATADPGGEWATTCAPGGRYAPLRRRSPRPARRSQVGLAEPLELLRASDGHELHAAPEDAARSEEHTSELQ